MGKVKVKIDEGFIPILRKTVREELQADAESDLDVSAHETLAETVIRLEAHGRLLDQIGWDETDGDVTGGIEVELDPKLNRYFLAEMVAMSLQLLSGRIAEASGDYRGAAEPDVDALRELAEVLASAAATLDRVRQPKAAVA